MEACRITVIMAIYNCADTLIEALDSLYSQTYQGFKIILCDDFSTDNTYELAKQYADKHDHITLIKNEKNLKLAGALNRCIPYVDTEYVARMDGDDISLPKRFEDQMKFLDDHSEYAIVSCGMILFDESGVWGVETDIPRPTIKDFRNGTPHSHAPAMVRTEALRKIGGYTDTPMTVRNEDFYLWFKFYKAGYRGYNLPDSYYMMRLDMEAFSRRKFKHRWNYFLVKWKVLRELNLPFPFLGALSELGKAFIPAKIMSQLHKNRYKKQRQDFSNQKGSNDVKLHVDVGNH